MRPWVPTYFWHPGQGQGDRTGGPRAGCGARAGGQGQGGRPSETRGGDEGGLISISGSGDWEKKGTAGRTSTAVSQTIIDGSHHLSACLPITFLRPEQRSDRGTYRVHPRSWLSETTIGSTPVDDMDQMNYSRPCARLSGLFSVPCYT